MNLKSFASEVVFSKKLPSLSTLKKVKSLANVKKFLIIYDRKLSTNKAFMGWVSKYDYTYGVTAGEKLKDAERFSWHLKRIIENAKGTSAHELCIVGVGGGSVGDFTGFVASVYKRGTHLVHIPSTWLAAMDSAHGGKTALNVGPYKNQMGSFYPAEAVFIARELLDTLSVKQLQSAYGELLKTAILSRPNFLKKLLATKLIGGDLLWEFLPEAVQFKYRVVKKDPYEKKGFRQILNLGHTLGHVLESHYSLPHGIAVSYGIRFSLDWSKQKGLIKDKSHSAVMKGLEKGFLPKHLKRGENPLTEKDLLKIIKQDKKNVGNKSVNFIFIEGPGKTPIHKVSFKDLVKEAKRQGWV